MKFVVNIKSHIIHTNDCGCGEKIRKEFKKTYNTYEKAKNCLDIPKEKCEPCKLCRPDLCK